MKKLISTISTLVLIFMIPALFIGYLYTTGDNVTSQPNDNTKTDQVSAGNHANATSKLIFTIKG